MFGPCPFAVAQVCRDRLQGRKGAGQIVGPFRVEVVAQGPDDAVARLVALLSEHPSTTRRPGRVTQVTTQWSDARASVTGFVEK